MLPLRLCLLLVGLASVTWSSSILPSLWLIAPAREVVSRIIDDARFKPGVLATALNRIQAEPASRVAVPESLQAVALIWLQIAEEAVSRAGPETADREIATAERNVKSALAANPNDALLWLLLYSVVTTREGFAPSNLVYIDQSYAVGPLEGWISLRRNRLMLAVFSLLSATSQDAVVSEFAQMVDSDFMNAAATNLTSVGWPNRERLLNALSGIDIVSKRNFSKRLSADGVKASIPGLEIDERPWR